ncbi:MAG: CapA family protein, partial [Jiangellaceae bacterium]
AVGGSAVGYSASPQAALDAVRADSSVLALVPADEVDPTVRVLTVGGVHPLRTPETYPLLTDADSPPGTVVTVTVVGDIMLGRRVGAAMAAAGDLAGPLRPLADRLASADVTVGNLESTLSRDGSPTQGGDSFAADPGIAAGLQLAGFDVLSLANNHVGDWGGAALVQTVDRVRAMGIQPVGAGADLAGARAPVILERDGVRIGIIATESIGESPAAGSAQPGTNRLNMPPRTGPLDQAALQRITGDIAALKTKVDTVIVIPHWGTQYTNVPEPSQRQVAAAFAEAGADLVIGGHPHWVQGWEMVGSTLVAHSLGNFVFDMTFSTQVQQGVALELVFWGDRPMAARLLPYRIGDRYVP